MAEHSAVNRRVVSSSLTCGANISKGTLRRPFVLCAAVSRKFMFWVYILKNPHGKFYVGQTKDLAARLNDHNRTDSFDGHYTRKNSPWKLVWSEEHPTRSSAMQRELQIKRMKSAKWIRSNLIETSESAVNPDLSGL